MIGTLFPIALCGRSSSEYLRQASKFFSRIRTREKPVLNKTFSQEPTVECFDEGIIGWFASLLIAHF